MDESQAAHDRRVARRAELLEEEQRAGSDDPRGQAAAILADSDQRSVDRDAAPGTFLERRHAEDTIDPT